MLDVLERSGVLLVCSVWMLIFGRGLLIREQIPGLFGLWGGTHYR